MITLVKKVNPIKDISTNVYKMKFKGFKQKVSIRVEKSKYLVKTAENSKELLEAFKLRYEVFNLKNRRFLKLDIDQFDKDADHLLIYDTQSKNIVGTYRILCSKFTDKFYSEGEFDISQIKNLHGEKVELGRACIRQDYRNGITLMLLWRAISEYVAKVKADYLFGCSSVFTTDPFEVAFITYHLIKNYASENIYVKPYKTIDRLDRYINFIRENCIDTSPAEKMIPSLLKMYLNAGSKICGAPSLDEDFGCVDFFTILDTEKLAESFKRKYKKDA